MVWWFCLIRIGVELGSPLGHRIKTDKYPTWTTLSLFSLPPIGQGPSWKTWSFGCSSFFFWWGGKQGKGSPWIGKFTLHCFTPFKEFGKDEEGLSKLLQKSQRCSFELFHFARAMQDPCWERPRRSKIWQRAMEKDKAYQRSSKIAKVIQLTFVMLSPSP